MDDIVAEIKMYVADMELARSNSDLPQKMLSSFSDILNNLISKGETMLNSFESKHSALVTILDNLSQALDDPVKASVDQMTNFPPWREIFSEIRFKNRHLLPNFDCLENKELQDEINSLDKGR